MNAPLYTTYWPVRRALIHIKCTHSGFSLLVLGPILQFESTGRHEMFIFAGLLMLTLPFRYLLAFTRAFLLVIPMAVLIILYLVLSRLFFSHTMEKAFRLRRLYLKYASFILGIRTRVEGNIPLTNALYVCNHRSLSDPLIICQYVDAFIIAKAEVANYPLISTGAELTGILYVHRENRDSRSKVREKMKDTLLQGYNVLVYPEGTVNNKLRTLPYRAGTFKELAKLKLPVVPLCLEYRDAKDVWHDRGLFEHFFLQFGYLTTHTRLRIGQPIQGSDGEELRRIAEQWTNEAIREIHMDWNSLFSPLLQEQSEERPN